VPADPVDRLVRRGEILRDLGRREEARAAFEEALRLDPGNARARTGIGWLLLETNRPAEALAEFRQAHPRLPMTVVGQALALHRLGRLREATEMAEDGEALFPGSPILLTQAAFFHLLQGRVEEARAEVEEALKIDPGYGPAYELLARVFLVQNQKQAAAEAAQRAVQANPRSPGALLTLSLVRQAEFQLDEALRLAQDAAKLDPTSAQPYVFEARLLFGMGYIKEAFRAIDRAAALARDDPFVLTTRGFLLLAQRDDYAAQTHFEWALDRDSTQGLPYVGLGLIHFQRREMEAGLQAMLAATLLEPRNALFNSYYGKALWEAGRRDEALPALALAKELDPKDPTPYLYAGIFNTDLNKPAQAIRDFYEAIARNDNRAVYRSRFLLDRDLATTNVSMARAFGRFGQVERARSLALTSLEADPGNHSAHLLYGSALSGEGLGTFLAARSELYQGFLLQPVNANATASFNDYTSLFDRPRMTAQVNGRLDSPRLQDYDVQVSAGNSYVAAFQGLGYFRNTGVHKINDDELARLTQTLFKVAPTIDTELAFLGAFLTDKFGDLSQDQNYFMPNNTAERNGNNFLFLAGGIHHRLGPDANLLLSVQGARLRFDTANSFVTPGSFFGLIPFQDFESLSNRQRQAFLDTQAALTHRLGNHRLTYFFDYFNGVESDGFNWSFWTGFDGSRFRNRLLGTSNIFLAPPLTMKPTVRREFLSALIQDTWAVHPKLHLTAGLQFDYAADWRPTTTPTVIFTPLLFPGPPVTASLATADTLYGSHWNPRAGITYQLTEQLLLRAAFIRSLETHADIFRIAPTQVAGFLIDHPGRKLSSARLTQYHLGWDGNFGPRLFLQAQMFYKVIDVPEVEILNGGRVVSRHRFSRLGARTSLNVTLTDTLALSAGYLRFRRSDATDPLLGTLASEGDEDQALVAVNFVHPSGLFARAETLYTRQDLALYRTPGSPPDFWITNLRVGYEFPQKWGTVTVGVRNLFRERFQFRQDFPFLSDSLLSTFVEGDQVRTSAFQTTTQTLRLLVPDRSYFFHLSLNF
jgi:tetratricopeptide (TPR) repeat protein